MTSPYRGKQPAATRLPDRLDALAWSISAALLIVVYAQWTGPVRLLLTVGFAFFVPGRAIVANWPRMARWSEVVMPMVFSLAVLTLLAMITLWASIWHPVVLFEAEAWLSMAGLCVGVARRHGHTREPSGRSAGTPAQRYGARTW